MAACGKPSLSFHEIIQVNRYQTEKAPRLCLAVLLWTQVVVSLLVRIVWRVDVAKSDLYPSQDFGNVSDGFLTVQGVLVPPTEDPTCSIISSTVKSCCCCQSGVCPGYFVPGFVRPC